MSRRAVEICVAFLLSAIMLFAVYLLTDNVKYERLERLKEVSPPSPEWQEREDGMMHVRSVDFFGVCV